jgi:hypothetical protein
VGIRVRGIDRLLEMHRPAGQLALLPRTSAHQDRVLHGQAAPVHAGRGVQEAVLIQPGGNDAFGADHQVAIRSAVHSIDDLLAQFALATGMCGRNVLGQQVAAAIKEVELGDWSPCRPRDGSPTDPGTL